MLTRDQIIAMLGDLESDRVERTTSTSDTDKFSRAVCAFANDMPGHRRPGVLLIGANDDGALKHYRSLMPMAMTAHKPMFLLKEADGARGAHLEAVQACYDDFYQLARRIGDRLGVRVP
jgi:hypothetical protein